MLGISSVARTRSIVMRRSASVVAAMLFVAFSTSPLLRTEAQESAPEEDLISSVSGKRILSTVRDLEGFVSRAFYLSSADDSAQYINDRFADIGLAVEYQELMAGPHRVRNVIATLPGTSGSEGVLLFGAHYDSENMLIDSYEEGLSTPAPGADDDASGIAVILEIATVLSTQTFPNTIKFVAFAAEELGYDESGGLKGSSYFVESERSRGVKYDGSAIVDMIGYRAADVNRIAAVVNSNETALQKAISDSATTQGLSLQIDVKVNASITWSDHSVFWRAGYPSVLLIEELVPPNESPVNPNYHSSNDTSDKLSESQMENATKAVVGGVLQMAQSNKKENAFTWIELGLVVLAAIVIMAIYIRRRKV